MRKYGVSLALVLLFFYGAPPEAESQLFGAIVTGDQEVPPVDTPASSIALFSFLFNDSVFFGYRLNFGHVNDVTAVHIHEAPRGVDGPIVLNMRPEGFCLDITGLFTIYFATADQLRGSLAGKSLSDLKALMLTGDTYINLHTEPHPGGEIRGQFPPQ